MKTIQQGLKSNNLYLNEATDVAQNCPLWRPMSMFGVALLVVHCRNDDDDVHNSFQPQTAYFLSRLPSSISTQTIL